MKKNLSVTLIQSELVWEDPEANRQLFSKKLNAISEATDLVVLPEMFTTGFTMNAASLAEPNDGPTLNWMQDHAESLESAITGSVIIEENGQYYNRLFFVLPDRSYDVYDKKHTFTLAGEHKVYTSGSDKLLVNYHGWKICPLICYDLRFPVWARNTEDYDLLLFVANWPEKRVTAWNVLLQARAIENMCYCIGVNRTGADGKGHEYIGHSAAFDVLGKKVSQTTTAAEFTETIALNSEHLRQTRKKLQFLSDRDRFSLA